MIEVLVLGAALLAVVLFLAWSSHPRRSQMPGLQRELGGRIEDRWLVLSNGLRVRRGARGQLEATAPVRTPGRVSVRTTASGLRIEGSRELLGGAHQKLAGIGALTLVSNTLHVVANAGTAPRFVERVQDLVKALEQSWLSAWGTAGRARGLRLDGDRLHGEVDGLRVQVFVDDGLTHILVEGDLRDVNAAHKDIDIPYAQPTGNAVLDLTLTVRNVEGPLEDDLVEKMMPVLHAWPGSTLLDGRLTMRMPGTVVDGIGERIDEALALARAVRR